MEWMECQCDEFMDTCVCVCLYISIFSCVIDLILIPVPTFFPDSRYLLNPALTSSTAMMWYKFLGILLGVAMRTKKPLDLHLAPILWKQLAGMVQSVEDLEEVIGAGLSC